MTALLACQAGAPWPAGLEAVEHPDLSAVEEVARRQIATRRDELLALLERGRGEAGELADAFGRTGRLYHAYRLYEVALACYRNALALDPASFRWTYYLGLAERSAGRFEAARGSFERALRIAPDNRPARWQLGEALLLLNDSEGARESFAALLDDARFAAAAHAGLGRAATSSGDPERAVEHFRKALELDPRAQSLHQPLGRALTRLGRLDDARFHLEKKGAGVAGFPDPLAERLEELAQSAGSHLRRANRALMNGRVDEAVEGYRKAVEIDPANVAARRNLALSLLRRGEARAAVPQLEAALEIDGADAQLHLDLANARRAAGLTDGAVAAYRKALELAPDLFVAHFNLGNTLAEADRWAEASEHLEKARALDPQDRRVRFLAAMALHHQGRSAEAVAALEALLGEEPTDEAARRGLASVYAALRRPQEARALYRAALDLDLPAAAKVEMLTEAARLAWRTNRRREAVADFRQLVQIAPTSEAYTQLANALQLTDERAEAAELFAKARELDPKNATAWLSEASLRILAGEYGAALSSLETGLEQAGHHQGLAHTLARFLATCPDAAYRDGQRALVLAQQVYSREQNLEHAATVGMALAEQGRFEQAIRWQRSLLGGAARSDPTMAKRLVAHLKLYEERKPVRIE